MWHRRWVQRAALESCTEDAMWARVETITPETSRFFMPPIRGWATRGARYRPPPSTARACRYVQVPMLLRHLGYLTANRLDLGECLAQEGPPPRTNGLECMAEIPGGAIPRVRRIGGSLFVLTWLQVHTPIRRVGPCKSSTAGFRGTYPVAVVSQVLQHSDQHVDLVGPEA